MAGFDVSGRTVFVTGAARGIGRAIAIGLAHAGCDVAVSDIAQSQDGITVYPLGSDAELAVTAGQVKKLGRKCTAIQADVTKPGDTETMMDTIEERLGGLDILVANAGIIMAGPVASMNEAQWDRIFAVNVKGAFLMSRAVLPMMIAAGGGSIIHIASQLGRVGAPHRVAYCSTKGAVIQLAKAMAVDHARDNVRVNALSPGAVATRRMLHRYGGMDEARREAGPKHLLNRLGEPDEIAQAALFLASDGASFMTGADLLVDGGYTTI